MKHTVRVDLTSSVLEPGGESRETCHSYPGTLYSQGRGHYLVYDDDGILTTLRWDDSEIRLYRRGDRMEAYQVFRAGERYDFELSLMGSTLPMAAHTHHWNARTDAAGGEVTIAYSLTSGDADLGEFSLNIRIRPVPEATESAPPPGLGPLWPIP